MVGVSIVQCFFAFFFGFYYGTVTQVEWMRFWSSLPVCVFLSHPNLLLSILASNIARMSSTCMS
ncbi:hypothetical protein LX32DRAFT_271540 [Colletotrichum zoysiae]|uniref:Uncharacterized protein n=1 Tax=Colletotrichum zoysiae TaxID=1216348 RepID=A0AAD9H2C6_9PEZI|nr:hypothetical protein LX32DRAFT_271540 [Colletotrichum zoysiae]